MSLARGREAWLAGLPSPIVDGLVPKGERIFALLGKLGLWGEDGSHP